MRLIDSLHPRFRNALEEFIGNLLRDLRSGFEVYLFGSLARGDYLLDSDIDVIVVTDALGGMKAWERTAYLRKLAPGNIGFDIVCYTKEEFREIHYLWRDILRIV